MAEDKNSFLFYSDWGDIFDQLPDDKAGKLIKHICDYVRDLDPETDDLVLNIAFTGIRNTLKRDLKSWETTKGKKSNSGALGNLKRWNLDLYQRVKANGLTIEEAVKIAKERKTSHSDKSESHRVPEVAVSDSVSETGTDSETESINNDRERIQNYLISSFTWKEKVIRTLELEKLVDPSAGVEPILVTIDWWIEMFCTELDAKDDLFKSDTKNKSHFVSWVKIKIKQQKKDGTTGKSGDKPSRFERTAANNMETAQQFTQNNKRGSEDTPVDS